MFSADVKSEIENYVGNHLASERWFTSQFDFVTDVDLAARLGEEFISARHIYKIFEGLGADEWMQRAQVRIQVLQYASIYEAVLHHILFHDLAGDARVIGLLESTKYTRISIPKTSHAILEKYLAHSGEVVIPMVERKSRTSDTKVRFDRKAECAASIGIISESLRDDLIEIYEARNAIHIHAEIRKELAYELELSKKAYRRMKPFREQILAWQLAHKATPAP